MRHSARPLLAVFSFVMALVTSYAVATPPAALPSPSPVSTPVAIPPLDDVHTALRAHLFNFAGIMGNEGFKFRDGYWAGTFESGKPQRLRVHLFSGNQYWFALATPLAAPSPKLSIYLPDGKPIKILEYKQPGLRAAGFIAPTTGQYFVEIQSPAASEPFVFFYLFK